MRRFFMRYHLLKQHNSASSR